MVFTVIFYVISNVFFKCLKNLFKKISYCDGVFFKWRGQIGCFCVPSPLFLTQTEYSYI